MRKTHLSICLDVVGSLKTGCFSKINKNHEAARLNNLLPTLDPKKIILDNQDQKIFQEFDKHRSLFLIIKALVTIIIKISFSNKRHRANVSFNI